MELVINKQRDRQKGLSAFLLFFLLKIIPAFHSVSFLLLFFEGYFLLYTFSCEMKNQEDMGKETGCMKTETGVGILGSY